MSAPDEPGQRPHFTLMEIVVLLGAMVAAGIVGALA